MKNSIIILTLRSALATLVLLSLFTSFSFAQNPEKTFQEAIMLEEAEGDLEQAIERYYMVTNDVSAEVAVTMAHHAPKAGTPGTSAGCRCGLPGTWRRATRRR